jgi:hypothetical protein
MKQWVLPFKWSHVSQPLSPGRDKLEDFIFDYKTSHNLSYFWRTCGRLVSGFSTPIAAVMPFFLSRLID